METFLNILSLIFFLISFTFLVVGLVKPSLFKLTRPKVGLYWFGSWISFSILIAIASPTQSESVKNTIMETTTSTDVEKQWTIVCEFKGDGIKKSHTFELTGGEARLSYGYKGSDISDIGVFCVYVVDEGTDIMKTGGFTEVMTTENETESQSYIHKSSGRYYLDVKAVGNWIVIVEEFK